MGARARGRERAHVNARIPTQNHLDHQAQ